MLPLSNECPIPFFHYALPVEREQPDSCLEVCDSVV